MRKEKRIFKKFQSDAREVAFERWDYEKEP